jgi:hypothetical protein
LQAAATTVRVSERPSGPQGEARRFWLEGGGEEVEEEEEVDEEELESEVEVCGLEAASRGIC